MNKFIYFLIFLISLCMYCGDGRAACYAEPNRIRSPSCELAFIIVFNNYNGDVSRIPSYSLNTMILNCLLQEQDRKTCDNRSEWWPLPKTLIRVRIGDFEKVRLQRGSG